MFSRKSNSSSAAFFQNLFSFPHSLVLDISPILDLSSELSRVLPVLVGLCSQFRWSWEIDCYCVARLIVSIMDSAFFSKDDTHVMSTISSI